MDFSLISGLVGSLKATYDLGSAAVGVRDANKLTEAVAEMNHKLLDAQQRLFAISSEAWALQQQLIDTQKENLELKATLEERGRYVLVELAKGNFALRSKVKPTDASEPVDAEPEHYLCQPCFHKGVKVVLGLEGGQYSPYIQRCAVCKHGIEVAPAPLQFPSPSRDYSPF
ncbi:hypothetical protein ABIC33_001287 [Variovorax sp. 1140]|uniref:hypothetical protein n=1 Tax=Variovorax atrisoli TaxID=3394203 RepID=UPI00339791BD